MGSDQNRWSLKLFFSVDLSGSTSYKVKMSEQKDDYEWCLTFEEFYKGFPIVLKEQYANLPKSLVSVESPCIWKYLGDEILFFVELSSYNDVVPHLMSLQKSLLYYNADLAKKDASILRCKGTAWLAGFPINNIEIDFGDKDNSSHLVDFIGPSIDLGFRVAKYATTRKLAMSIDLVLMFADAVNDLVGGAVSDVKGYSTVRFEGRKELKGVLNNTPYPIFWLEIGEDEHGKNEDEWLGLGSDCKPVDLIEYAKHFIKLEKGLVVPFIENDTGKKYDVIPDEMPKRKLDALEARKRSKEILSEYAEDVENKDDDKTKNLPGING